MTVPQLGVSWTVARRVFRRGFEARLLAFVATVGLAVLVMWTLLQALSLSGEQQAERTLGTADGSAGFGLITPLQPGQRFERIGALRRSARLAGASAVDVHLSAPDIQVSSASAAGSLTSVTMVEAPWGARPYPGRYRLRQGRWPQRPGEVVLIDGDELPFPVKSIRILGGRAGLTVVGSGEDRYFREPSILSAQGTWQALSPSVLAEFRQVVAYPFVTWKGGEGGSVVSALGAAAVDPARRAEFEDTAVLRSALVDARSGSVLEQAPAGYLIPSIVLPPFAVLVMVLLMGARLQRAIDRMVACGANRRTAALGVTVAIAGWVVLASVVGAVVGHLLGRALAPAVAEWRGRPAGPIGLPVQEVLLLVGLTVLTALAGGIHLARSSGSERRPRRWPGRLRWARRAAAGICFIVAAQFAVRLDSSADGLVLSVLVLAGAVCLVPDLVRVMLTKLAHSVRRPQGRLALHRMLAAVDRVSSLSQVLVVVIGLALSYVVMLDTLSRTADESAIPSLLPGQIVTQDPGFLFGQVPLRFQQFVDQHPTVASKSRSVVYATATTRGGDVVATVAGGNGATVLALDSESDVAAALAVPALNDEQRATFRTGGILVPTPVPDATGTIQLTVDAGENTTRATVPAVHVAFPRIDWLRARAGIMSTSSVRRRGWPITQTGVLYTGIDAGDAEKIVESAIAAGLDPQWLTIARPPASPVPPVYMLLIQLGLVAIAVASMVALAYVQARSLRRSFGRLVSIGVTPTWCKTMLGIELAVALTIAVAVALLAAVLPAIVVSQRLPGFVLSVPWMRLLAIVAALAVVAAVATITGARHLRPVTVASD